MAEGHPEGKGWRRGGRIRRRVEGELLWLAVQGRALLGGLPGYDLSRVREHIRFRVGLDRPEFPEGSQKPIGYFRGLTAKAWHDPRDFDCVGKLEAGFDVIRAELDALRAQSAFRSQHDQLTTSGNWNVYYFSIYGRRVREHSDRCPETSRIIGSIPGATSAGLAYFSAMAPGTHVAAHCGPVNTRLRCHLGLHVPAGAEIRVGSEIRPWSEGKCMVFDDSFEHEVWNRGTATRLVLLIDTWHPDLSASEIQALKVVERLSSRSRSLRRILDPGANRRTTGW